MEKQSMKHPQPNSIHLDDDTGRPLAYLGLRSGRVFQDDFPNLCLIHARNIFRIGCQV